MPVLLLQFSFYLIPLLGWLWHGSIEQFAQGHAGKQCVFFCQPPWFLDSHLRACVFVGHRRRKAAGRCVENGQNSHVMTMPGDLGEQVGHVCMLSSSGCQSGEEAYSLLLPIPCYLNRLQNLSFCHL